MADQHFASPPDIAGFALADSAGNSLFEFDEKGRLHVPEGVDISNSAKAFWAYVRQYAEADREAAVLAERERCAKVCEALQAEAEGARPSFFGDWEDASANECAAAIRSEFDDVYEWRLRRSYAAQKCEAALAELSGEQLHRFINELHALCARFKPRDGQQGEAKR